MNDSWNQGQPPGDPYGSPGGYDAPYGGGYGAPYGGGYPGYGPPGSHYPPPGPYTQPPPNSGSAIAALIISIIQMISCCGIAAAVGLIFSILAIGEKLDHEKQARYTRNAWISIWVNLGIIVLLVVVYIVVMLTQT